MDNKEYNKSIEINKFVYCLWAWCFTREIGSETLRDMARERSVKYNSDKVDESDAKRNWSPAFPPQGVKPYSGSLKESLSPLVTSVYLAGSQQLK